MKRVVAACAILISITIISAMSVGWLLAHPVQAKIGNPPADLNAESVVFASASGATVHGWWCPNQNAKGAVLLLPGIRANRLSMVERARFLSRAGYSILLIDFQATGNHWRSHYVWLERESRCARSGRFCSQNRLHNSSGNRRQFIGGRSCASGNSAAEDRCAYSRRSLSNN